MKVLIVDDYQTMRRIVRNLLTQIADQIGMKEADEASDGQEALGSCGQAASAWSSATGTWRR